jgi:hypothetical protein
MKKTFLAVLSGILLTAISCSKDETKGGPTAKPVYLAVNIAYSSAVAVEGLPKENIKVKIINLSNGQTQEMSTNADGTASFASITPGNYSMSAAITIPAATYAELSKTYVEADVVFNGNITSTTISLDSTKIDMELTAGRLGNWVFKQIYYAGSNASRGASIRDQFVEIYNNSNEVLYADSLYIGQVQGVNNTTNNASKPGYQSNNQYDWSQAYGMIDITRANTDYVYVKSLFMIPGSGKDHPVQPGQSIIFAQTGLNHAASYVLSNGVTQGITDPTLTIDLSHADFECYLVEYDRIRTLSTGESFSAYKFDVDNPEVANVTISYHLGGNDFVMDPRGYDALVLLQPQGENPMQWPAYTIPTDQNEGTMYTRCPQIPIKHVVDAVELQHLNSTSRVPKRLQNSLDAGPTNTTSGAYTSESIVRKTARMAGSRRILQDTNNSANDFVTKTKADPSKADASFAN